MKTSRFGSVLLKKILAIRERKEDILWQIQEFIK